MAGLAGWATEHEINTLITFPSVFRHLARTLEGETLPPIRLVCLWGEPVLPSDYEACRRLLGPQVPFAIVYGSSEAGILTQHRVVAGDVIPESGALPVGRAVEWVDVVVLDDEGRVVPPGETGEVAVRCEYLSPGYWGDEALTAARFSQGEWGREFRTGDLGRFSSVGTLSIVGRRDLQVKVRGNRISLTEVEGTIAALPDVTGAAVSATSTLRGDTGLTAYLTTRAGADLTAASVRQALGTTLPEREMPNAFIFLAELPVTPQGKVDREQLARITPPAAPAREGDGPTGGTSETEAVLAAIWSRAFELDQVGPDSDFFALGGDSLIASVIAAGAHASFGVHLDLRAIVDNPTVTQLASIIEHHRADAGGDDDRPRLERVSRAVPLPVSFAQERTWRFSQTPEQSAGYIDATRIRIRGPLDVALLRRAIDHLVERHEILRTTFIERDGEPLQVVHPKYRLDVALVDLSGAADPESEALDALAQMASAPFDLGRGPLLRLRLVRTAPDEHQLLWVDHHIISDAWSWRLFFAELRGLYEAFGRDEPARLLDELPFQYADFASWERRWLVPSVPHYQAEVDWWRESLRDAPAPPRLPFARTTPDPNADPAEGVIFWGLDPDVSRGLDRLGHEAAATYYMVRLAVLAAQVALETASYDLVLGTYASGRRLAQTHGMFGFFSNVVTLRLRLAPDLTFRQALRHVRACVIDTSPHTEFPYEELCEQLVSEGVVAPEIRLIFNLGADISLKMAGLELTTVRRLYTTMPWGFTFGPNQARESSECGAAFDARIYNPSAVREFLGRFQHLAAEVCSDPDRPLEALLVRT
jgi:hypothetical protein